MSASDLMEDAVGDWVFGTLLSPVYLALFTSSTGLESGDATSEVQTSATAGYNRQACAISQTSTGATNVWSNSDAESFTASGSGWTDVTHFALCAGGTPGDNDIYVYGALDTTIANINDGDTINFAIGELDFDVG